MGLSSIPTLDAPDSLPRTPASDLKKLGWRSVAQQVKQSGKVVITNHRQYDAVILSLEEYAAIREALDQSAEKTRPTLDALRARFDARMQVLLSADAGQRLRAVMNAPASLDGAVRAGSGH